MQKVTDDKECMRKVAGGRGDGMRKVAGGRGSMQKVAGKGAACGARLARGHKGGRKGE